MSVKHAVFKGQVGLFKFLVITIFILQGQEFMLTLRVKLFVKYSKMKKFPRCVKTLFNPRQKEKCFA